MRRVLITGAAGFIGSHCVPELIRRGFEVHGVVSKVPPPDDRGDITWHVADLLSTDSPARIVEEVAPTHLLHLAWFVEPGTLISSPLNRDWVHATADLAAAFAQGHGTRMVAAGSAYEYDWRFGYCVEGLTPCAPETLYGAAKHAAHVLVEAMLRESEVNLAWARMFFLYGPHEHPSRLVPTVARALIAGKPAAVSHGMQVRDYLYVADVARGLVDLLESDTSGAVNICSGAAIRLRDIIRTVAEHVGRPELVRFGAVAARANDAALVVGDPGRARLEFGWEPAVELEQGIESTVSWWREQGVEH
jgi:nucleoside-diphosphate-sugar epimerase